MREKIGTTWVQRAGRYELSLFGLPLGAQTIASWLTADVMSSASLAEFRRLFERVKTERLSGHLLSGNAFHTFAADGYVYIECEYSEDEKVLLKCDDAIRLLDDYLGFMNEAKRGIDNPPAPFFVEYEMAGQSAGDYYRSQLSN